MMRCHGWLHVAHSIAHRKKVQPPRGVASALHLPPRVASYRRQPRAIKSITPMGLPYHCPFITTTTMGTRITLRWDCVPHEHSSPRHGIGMVSDTSIYYNSITWGVPMPSQGVAHRMAINYQTHAIEVVRITPIYHRATTWDCVPHGHLSPYHNAGYDNAIMWSCVPHGHLSPYHNAGYGNAIMWSCVPHGHSSPNHAIEIVRIMAIYHHATA